MRDAACWLAKPETRRETLGLVAGGVLTGSLVALAARFLLWPALLWLLELQMRLLDRFVWS